MVWFIKSNLACIQVCCRYNLFPERDQLESWYLIHAYCHLDLWLYICFYHRMVDDPGNNFGSSCPCTCWCCLHVDNFQHRKEKRIKLLQSRRKGRTSSLINQNNKTTEWRNIWNWKICWMFKLNPFFHLFLFIFSWSWHWKYILSYVCFLCVGILVWIKMCDGNW